MVLSYIYIYIYIFHPERIGFPQQIQTLDPQSDNGECLSARVSLSDTATGLCKIIAHPKRSYHKVIFAPAPPKFKDFFFGGRGLESRSACFWSGRFFCQMPLSFRQPAASKLARMLARDIMRRIRDTHGDRSQRIGYDRIG